MRQATVIETGPGPSAEGATPSGAGLIPPFRLNRRQPTADQIYLHLRNAILSWQLLPNQPMSENRISAVCGVSRSPVRTALARLAEDGLIDVFPQRGTFVAPIRFNAVREAQFVRAALELALVEEAVTRWSHADGQELRSCLARQQRHVEERDAAGFYAENEVFHLLIAKAAGLEGVWKTIQSVKTLWDRVGHIANQSSEHLEAVMAEHRQISDALDRKDRSEARHAMTVHMNSITKAIERLRPAHPEFFDE